MGWNNISKTKPNLLLNNLNNSNFYFLHSYFLRELDQNDILATTNYGSNFVSAFCKGNIYGVQFHPEKSQLAGKIIIDNFLNI